MCIVCARTLRKLLDAGLLLESEVAHYEKKALAELKAEFEPELQKLKTKMEAELFERLVKSPDFQADIAAANKNNLH